MKPEADKAEDDWEFEVDGVRLLVDPDELPDDRQRHHRLYRYPDPLPVQVRKPQRERQLRLRTILSVWRETAMWEYSDKVRSTIFNPRNSGPPKNNATGDVSSIQCGDALR